MFFFQKTETVIFGGSNSGLASRVQKAKDMEAFGKILHDMLDLCNK